MIRRHRAAVGLPGLLLLCTAGCSRGGPAAPPDGAQVFAAACARCHGPTGRGDGQLAQSVGGVPDLRTSTADADTVRRVVVEGRGTMPPHRGRLPAEHIEVVVPYVLQLRD